MAVKYTNNAKTTLASGLTNSATSASVTDGSVFPSLGAGEYFYITFDDGSNNEIAKVTARSGNTLTIVRAQDNTSARAFSTGDSAELRVIAAVLTEIQENIAAKSANQTVYSATAASNATDYNIGVDPGVEANASVFLDGVYQHHDTFSFSGSTLTFDAAPTNGTKIEVVVDNLINLQSSNLTVDTFTATSGQTAFTLSDAPGGESNVLAFIDGVFQNQASFTLSSNTLTFDTGVVVGRSVTVYIINPVNIGTPSDNTVTSAKLSGNITLPGSLTVGAYDVAFDSPTFVVDNANSRVGIGTASPSTGVLDIVGDVTTSSHINIGGNLIKGSGDLTLDVAGDIILDADGGDIVFRDAGSSKLFISNSSDDVLFTNGVQDKDLIFKGYDGTSLITALTLDMSEAGAATFNGNVTVPYLATTSYIDLNNSGNRGKIGWSGNHTYIATTSSVGSIIFKNNVGSTDAPQTGGDTLLTLADNGNATFAGKITSTELTITGGSDGADVYINNTSPTLAFTDSNSFSDSNDMYIIRGASTGHLQFQFFDNSANTTTSTFLIDNEGNADFVGAVTIQDGNTDFVISGDSNNNTYFISNGEFRIRPVGTTTNKFVIGSNGNLTTAGTISSGAISSSGLLTLTGASILLNESANNEQSVRVQNSTVTAYFGVEGSSANRFSGSAANNMFLGTTTEDGIEFATNNTVRATIDSSGAATFNSTLAASDTTLTASSVGAVALNIKRSGATGRAQFALQDESGNNLWRVGATGPGSTDFAFFDGGANVMKLTATDDTVTFASHILPDANAGNDIGSSSLYWRDAYIQDVYTQDLHLSNEDREQGGNDVDGTTGNWTIQEGEENLYIINNKTGKKFKFALEEVS